MYVKGVVKFSVKPHHLSRDPSRVLPQKLNDRVGSKDSDMGVDIFSSVMEGDPLLQSEVITSDPSHFVIRVPIK